MKYFTIMLLLIGINQHADAQSSLFKPFKIDIGIVGAVSLDDEAGNGPGFYLEPKYQASDRINVGLRLESVFLTSGSISIGPTAVDLEAASVFPILLTGDYYFNTERVRPYAGLGIGVYIKDETSINTDIGIVNFDLGSKTNFGVAPRLGLNAGHFKLAIIYNYTGDGIADYLGISIGAEIGGGYQ